MTPDVLHNIRSVAGLTQSAMAEKLSVTPSMVCQMEKGKLPIPQAQVVKIAAIEVEHVLQHERDALERLTKQHIAYTSTLDNESRKRRHWHKATQVWSTLTPEERTEALERALKLCV